MSMIKGHLADGLGDEWAFKGTARAAEPLGGMNGPENLDSLIGPPRALKPANPFEGLTLPDPFDRMRYENRQAAIKANEGQMEFKVLGPSVLDRKGSAYSDAAAYLKDRNSFFGSAEKYDLEAADSDCEFEEIKDKLRNALLDKETVKRWGTDKAERFLKYLYRWTRKAYMNHGVTDVPQLIKKGASQELIDAVKKVNKSTGEHLVPLLTPRPMKIAPDYKYRLGTISEHAWGLAIDIIEKENPTISVSDWTFIQTLTGKNVNRSESRWKTDPKGLWTDIDDLNDLFVAKIKSEIKRIEAERVAKAAKDAKDAKGGVPGTKSDPKKASKPLRSPIDEVLAGHHGLIKRVDGFFSLEWDLVHQLHIAGFIWGATFNNQVDLHHFEVRKSTP